MAASRTLTVQFAGSDKGLKRGLQDALNGLDDIDDAGKRAAAAINIFADQTEANMREAAAATDVLKTALGDETVAAIEQAGGSVERWVADLRKLGATYEDVAANADELATAIRRAEDVNASSMKPLASGADDAATSVRRLGNDADQSRSVLANMVGNSLQDLGALGGVAGSAGVMLGQLGEYAADGNIKIGNLVALAGPMAGLGAATLAVSAASKSAAENARIAKQETALWMELQGQMNAAKPPDLSGTAEKLVEQYQGTIEAMEGLGYSVQDFVDITRGSTGALDEMLARQDELASKAANSTDGLRSLSDSELAEYDTLTALTSNLMGYTKEQANSVVAYDDKTRRVNEMQSALEGEYQATAQAKNIWEQYAAVINASTTDFADADKAATTHANRLADLRERVEAYIATTRNIPEEVITDIRAALDAGNISAVEALITELTRPRLINIGVALSPATGTKGRGGGSASPTGAKNPGVGGSSIYDPSGLLSDILNPSTGGGGGGGAGGGGGGGASSDPMAEWDSAMSVLYETGQISLDAYRTYLSGRLSAFETYSKEYKTIWDGLRALDQDEKRAQDELAAAEEKRRKAAEEAAKKAEELAQKQLDSLQQLAKIMLDFRAAGYGNLEGTGGNVVGAGVSAADVDQILWLLADQLRRLQEGNQ